MNLQDHSKVGHLQANIRIKLLKLVVVLFLET